MEASSAEVATEVKAVERSAVHLCPIEVVLERVIATPTGNVLACWQILGGSDPTAVRRHVFLASPSVSPQSVRLPVQESLHSHSQDMRILMKNW